MEKQKRKGKPNRLWLMLALIPALIQTYIVWSWSYYVIPGHALSYLSRFESPEAVVAFLHEHFDLQVTTSAEIRDFLGTLGYVGCRDRTPRQGDFANYTIDENVAKIMNCSMDEWHGFPGISTYYLSFYMSTDDKLVYIVAGWSCICW